MCLAQGHNAVTPMKLEPAAVRSRVKHSTTEPLRSHFFRRKRFSYFVTIKLSNDNNCLFASNVSGHRTSVVDPEGVTGVRSNPPPRPVFKYPMKMK